MKNLKVVVIAFAICIAGVGRIMATEKPVIEVSIWLGEDVDSFVLRNDAASRSDRSGRNPSFWYEAPANDPVHSGVRLRYQQDQCDHTFPAGRFLEVAQDGGAVSALTAVLPLSVLSFEEARLLAETIRKAVKAAGWEETRWYDDVSKEKVASNPGSKRARIAKWRPCGQAGLEAGLSIKDAGLEIIGTSVPLNAQRRADPVKAGGEYVLVLDIYKSAE